MMPLHLRFGIVVLLYLSRGCDLSDENCTLEDGSVRRADSEWVTDDGCRCQCVSHETLSFVQCDPCKKVLNNLASTQMPMCLYNGFEYLYNETWMSADTPCSQCKCQSTGKYQCQTTKHCTNTCPGGQIPEFGPCCEVIKCKGKVVEAHRGMKCWDKIKNMTIEQGESLVIKGECIDRYCICYNGNWNCHNYCNISHHTMTYWNKLCCPRQTELGSCIYRNVSISSGRSHYFLDTKENCSCKSSFIKCSSYNISTLPPYRLHTRESISTKSSHTSQFPSLILIIFVLLIFLLLCSLAAIIVHTNLRIFKNKMCSQKTEANIILLSDVHNDPQKDNLVF